MLTFLGKMWIPGADARRLFLKNHFVKLFFAGDFCSRPAASRIVVSEDLKDLIRSCDLRIVNFEVPLKPDVDLPPQGRQRYFQSDDAPDFLRGLGFDLFQLANNHAFDWDEAGYRKTRKALGDAAFGAGTYEEAYRVKTVEAGGFKIGFLALSFAAYKGVFDDRTKYGGLGCAYINDLSVNHIIMRAKQEVDYLFVLPHDGIEYIDVPLPETIARYRDFIDYGADGVVGTHPHCPQGWESYKGKPIFYSLGNFLFNSKEGYSYRATKPHWYEGICAIVSIEDGVLSWEVVNTRNVDNVAIQLDSGEDRKAHNAHICSLLEDPAAYWTCFREACEREGYAKLLRTVDVTMHPSNMKMCTRRVVNYWWRKLTGRKPAAPDDLALERLFRHDANRQFLLWALRLHK